MSVTQPPLGTPLNKSHSLVNGLVCYWLLNEGGGKVIEDSYNNIPIAFMGSTSPTLNIKQRGQTATFAGGSNSSINFPNTGNGNKFGGNLATDACTYSAWINPTSSTAVKVITGVYGSSGLATATYMAYNATTRKLLGIWGTAVNTPITTSNTTFTAGAWYHVVMVRYGSTGAWTCDLYVNGILDATATTATNPSLSANPNGWIGAVGNNVFTFIGSIQDVGMWNRALTPNEIKGLYTDPYQMFIN